MSGWIGGKFWRTIWFKIPSSKRDDVAKATRKAAEVFSAEERKEQQIRDLPETSSRQPQPIREHVKSTLIRRGNQKG